MGSLDWDVYILPHIQWWIWCWTYCMHWLILGIRPYLSPLADRFLPEASRWLDQLDFSCAEDYHVLVHRSWIHVSDCACQVTWIQSLLGELSYKLNAIPICSDNQGSIFMASNPVTEPCSKHIDIRYHGICKSITNGKIELFFIDGAENPADLPTKNLPCKKFAKFRVQLGLQFPSGSS